MDSTPDTAQLLSSLEPGKLPRDVFNEVARLTVTPVVEVVPFFRDDAGVLKVFLLQRNTDDALWPGMYHVPGTIVNANDTTGSFNDALQRILVGKLMKYGATEPVMVDTQLCKVSRGTEVAIIYMTSLNSAPDKTSLFDPKKLPSKMIEGQEQFIETAFRRFNSLTGFVL